MVLYAACCDSCKGCIVDPYKNNINDSSESNNDKKESMPSALAQCGHPKCTADTKLQQGKTQVTSGKAKTNRLGQSALRPAHARDKPQATFRL